MKLRRKDPGRAREKLPHAVAWHLRRVAEYGRRRRWIEAHLLPAPRVVRTLRAFLADRLRRIENRLKVADYRRFGADYHARYCPRSHVSVIAAEGEARAIKYLLLTLRVHGRSFSRPAPKRMTRLKRLRRAHALQALAAVGTWWLHKPKAERPKLMRRDRHAIKLCCRIELRMRVRSPRSMAAYIRQSERTIEALKWENKNPLRAVMCAPG